MFIDLTIDSPSSPLTSSSPVHHASLVDPATHSPALLELVQLKITKRVIAYVVECVAETVDHAMGRRSSSSSRGRSSRRPENDNFTTFATNVITRAEITTPTLLTALVYIDRAKPHLHIALEEWALERVFLGAIIAASKYLNDSTLKNVHWALCTGVFGKRDVGRIEREFLDVLDFELSVTEDDLLSHHHPLSTIASQRHSSTQFSHPHSPRSHRRERHHTQSSVAVPALEPSSPESSSSSSTSPQTPAMMEYEAPQLQQHPAPIATKKPSSSSSTLDSILRSFPLPLPTPSHRRPRHSREDPSQFPISVVA